MAQLIQFTLRHGPTIQTEMSLATAGIHCTICQRLSGAMEDCSIVRGRQLRTLCRQRCCMSASLRMFGSLWNAESSLYLLLHSCISVTVFTVRVLFLYRMVCSPSKHSLCSHIDRLTVPSITCSSSLNVLPIRVG